MRRFKFPKLSHPWAKSAAGFTLVELIVVIAILGVLAGVGTVGYSGYVKSSKKKADQVLVGNIMRAIETGTNSYTYVGDDSFKMGEFAFPVGFVALSTTGGAKVITSQTKQYPAAEGECSFVTVEHVTVLSSKEKTFTCKNSIGGVGCQETTDEVVYSIQEDVTIVYCEEHSTIEAALPARLPQTTSYPITYTADCEKSGPIWDRHYEHKGWDPKEQTIEANTWVVNDDIAGLYKPKADGICEAALAYKYDIYQEPDIDEAGNGDPMYDAIAAAFGGNLSDLKLGYDGWTTEEGADFGTFITSAPQLMEDMETLSGFLATGSQWPSVKSMVNIVGEYEDGAEAVESITKAIRRRHGEESWMKVWNDAAGEPWENPAGFDLDRDDGPDLYGAEHYASARMAYNNAFASYVAEMDPTITDAQLEALRGFYKPLPSGYEWVGDIPGLEALNMPALVNTDAFNDPESPLSKQFEAAGDSNPGAEGSAFSKCAALYETYKTSDACRENGMLVFKTLGIIADTSDSANAYADVNSKEIEGINYFDYYNTYINEMSTLYSEAMDAANGGIVIIVVVENGELNFQVTPSEANPRAE